MLEIQETHKANSIGQVMIINLYMKKLSYSIVLFFLFLNFSVAQERFVYEMKFEIGQDASPQAAEEMFFHWYDGFKQSQKCVSVRALQHHTGEGYDYRILAYTDSWDSIDDMMMDAQAYIFEKLPNLTTEPWPMVHTGDAVYAVRESLEEGYITQ